MNILAKHTQMYSNAYNFFSKNDRLKQGGWMDGWMEKLIGIAKGVELKADRK